MQIDMHFYGVYALARAAGMSDAIARKIAYASQFVDDAIDDDCIILDDNRAIVPTMTSHKPIDYQNALAGDQWKVWIPFHFLPGYKGKKIKISTKHSSGIMSYLRAKYEEFKTRFISGFPEVIPVGHGAVGTYPDRPYLAWEYTYELRKEGSSRKKVIRDNLKDFLKGSERIHEYFKRFVQLDPHHGDAGSGKDWAEIKPAVQDILKTEGPKDKRIEKWVEHLEKGTFCTTTNADKGIKYDEGLWRARRAELELEETGHIENSDACRFILAARQYRNYVLSDLLPDIGLTLP
jgi:hypothetical protein